MITTKARFLVHKALMEGKAPMYIAHRRDGWFVAAKGFVDEPKTRFRKVSRNLALRTIPELSRLSTLPAGFAAFRHRRSDAWTIEALPRGGTYLITYEARPSADNSNERHTGGACVNCWIRSTSMGEAKRKARHVVRSNGWNVVRMMTANRMHANDLTKLTAPYFRQVQIDGWVCLFCTYPANAPDA